MRVRSAMLAAMLVTMVAEAAAIEERPLPDFKVLTASGAEVRSAALSAEPKWVLLYVTPDCRACDRLLRALKDWKSDPLMARVVVVVRGTAAFTAPYIGRVLPPEVSEIRWHSDVDDEAWQSLELKGTPVLMGVEKGRIKWTVAGVLNDPKSLESVVRTWVEY